MKKIFVSLVLTLCLLLSVISLSSCEDWIGDPSISGALEKTDKLDEYHMVMNMNMMMRVDGKTTVFPTKYTVKVKGANTDSPTVYTVTETEIAGEKSKTEIYCEGEDAYIAYNGKGENAKLSEIKDVIAKIDSSSTVDAIIKDIPADLIEDVEFKENIDDSETLSLNLSEEHAKEIFSEMIGSINDLAGNETLDNCSIKNFLVKITVKDGYILDYVIGFDLVSEVAGFELTICVDADVSFVNPGKNVEITPPQGFEKK